MNIHMVYTVDNNCGKPVDNVDNFGEYRDIPPLFPGGFVDNPVETVDEYALWLCIEKNCDNVYEYPVTILPKKRRIFPPPRAYDVCNSAVYTQEILQVWRRA